MFTSILAWNQGGMRDFLQREDKSEATELPASCMLCKSEMPARQEARRILIAILELAKTEADKLFPGGHNEIVVLHSILFA